jgi:hypothetical protein
MKTQNSKQQKSVRKSSDTAIAKSYMDLRKLRDEVRKAELNCKLVARRTKIGGVASVVLNQTTDSHRTN